MILSIDFVCVCVFFAVIVVVVVHWVCFAGFCHNYMYIRCMLRNRMGKLPNVQQLPTKFSIHAFSLTHWVNTILYFHYKMSFKHFFFGIIPSSSFHIQFVADGWLLIKECHQVYWKLLKIQTVFITTMPVRNKNDEKRFAINYDDHQLCNDRVFLAEKKN